MVYDKREDTELMNEALQVFNLKDKKVMEMGAGNCFNSNYCLKEGAKVYSVDIDPEAKKYCKSNFVLSDMFENVKEKDFYLIFFNPPYLVSDKIEYIDLDGGNKGRELIDKFLDKFDEYLAVDGKVLLLHTDYNDLKITRDILTDKGYKMAIIKKKKLFFEELYILLINKI